MARQISRLFRRRRKQEESTAVQHAGDGSVGSVPPDILPSSGEMSFLEHLEDLRWTILKGIGGVIVMTILAAIFHEWVTDVVLLGPAKGDFFTYRILGIETADLHLQNRTPTGQFFALVGIVGAVGVVAGSPLLVYYLWKFIEPGLYPREKSGMRFISLFAAFFFAVGVLFGYFVITPLALNFFNNFVISDVIHNEFDITRYFSDVTMWSLGSGLLFELPVVVYFLTKMGIATPERLRKFRKYAFVGVFIIGAIVTPADPYSMVAAAIPLYALYEGSILVSGWVERKRERDLKKAWGESDEDEK